MQVNSGINLQCKNVLFEISWRLHLMKVITLFEHLTLGKSDECTALLSAWLN